MKTLIKAFIRIMALLFALEMLNPIFRNIAPLLSDISQWPRAFVMTNLSAALLDFVLAVLAIYFAWGKTDKVARMVAGKLNESEVVVSTTNARLYALIMSALGVYLFVTAFPKLLGHLAYTLYWSNYQQGSGIMVPLETAAEIEGWTTQVLTVAIGIWLIVGRRAMAKFVNNIWEFGGVGRSNEAEEEPTKPDSHPPAGAS